MTGFFSPSHNPDVLSCIANLSNDEIFTPPDLANQILDLLPNEIWQNTRATFLDPVCKSGVFLREIAKRLIRAQIPNFEMKSLEIERKIRAGETLGEDEMRFQTELQSVLDHIFKKQLFGMAITELTSLLSRRSVYCSKYPQCDYSIVHFENPEGNIDYKMMEHNWVKGRCVKCGATQKQYSRNADLESYAYEFIHLENPERVFDMKFDVIIGNPPYHLSDGSGGSTDSAIPIYQKFIKQAMKMNPKFLVMIVPSKWMVGGRGLDKFREDMISDDRLRVIVDSEDGSRFFPGLHLDGGVCYFLWERDYHGEVEYTFTSYSGETTTCMRTLGNAYSKYVIRDNRVLSLIDKTSIAERFSKIVSSTKPFGIRKYLFNDPGRYPDSNLSTEPFPNSVKVFGVKGIKGGARRTSGFITRDTVTSNIDDVDQYKLFFTTSYSANAVIPPDIISGNPGEVCTETFLEIGPFESEETRNNCKHYMETRFFRFLLYIAKGTMQVNRSIFQLLPLMDFTKTWDDKSLFEYFNLSQSEIQMITNLFEDTEPIAGEQVD